MVVPLKLITVIASITAITKSNNPFLYSPHGALEQSSKKPVSIAANTRIKYIIFSVETLPNNTEEAINTTINTKPAPLGLPAESLPSWAKSLPWSVGSFE